MYCKYCGHRLPDDANFCTMCGRVTEEEKEAAESYEEVIGTPTETSLLDEFKKEKDELAGKILTYSILGLSFGVSMILSLLGLIFTVVARNLIEDYTVKFGETEGRASVGKGLSIGGLAVSIFGVVFMALYITIIVIAISSGEPVNFEFGYYI